MGSLSVLYLISIVLIFSNIRNGNGEANGDGNINGFWEMEIFLEQVMEKWRNEVIVPTLDPMINLPVLNINMTFPSYLNLVGNIGSIEYRGLKDFKGTRIYADTRMIDIVLHINSDLIATHNLNGTIELDSGKVLLVGRGNEMQLNISSRPAIYTFRNRYTVGEDGYVVLDNYPDLDYIELRNRNGDEKWDWSFDLGGLLDPIPPEEEYLIENAHSWIATQILDRENLEGKIVDILEPSLRQALRSAFNGTKYEDIVSNPPSTPIPEPPLPTRVEVHVHPPNGSTIELKCTSNKNGQLGPKNFTGVGGSFEIEWIEPEEGTPTSWTCWGYWGETGVLWFWDDSWGFPLVRGFNIYGSTLVETIPRRNNTWLIDGYGKTRIEENGVPVNDKKGAWDFDRPEWPPAPSKVH